MLNIAPFKDIKRATRVTLPVYPVDWKPVKEFPNLSSAKTLAIDTETKDPELLQAGPGWGRGVGHVVGVSIATHDAAWYFPIRHELQPELNLNPAQLTAWLQDVLKTDIPKVFANASYDLGWLNQEGVKVNGKAYDVIVAEKLLNPASYSFSLDNISNRYLGGGKASNTLYEWCARAYGGKLDGAQRANVYRAPVSLVGPYAEADARLPFDIFVQQWKLLEKANLLPVFDLETRLLPVLVAMRLRGVAVSEEKAQLAKLALRQEIQSLQAQIDEIAGTSVNVNSPLDLETLFKREGVEIEYTAKNNPSFQAAWLERQVHPAAEKIRSIRKYTKAISTFIDGAVLNKHVNNRVYTAFNPQGAITGRFSSSSPNLQNIPKRDKKLGPIMRSIFLPDDGCSWLKLDYSSIEFRVFAHFIEDATLINAYKTNKHTDFHQVVEDLVGGGLPRVAYKTLSFSRMYGGGINTITKQMALNFTVSQQIDIISELGFTFLSNPAEQLARIVMNMYDKQFPAVADALAKAAQIAQQTGEMRTILGRRVPYDKWEPAKGKGFPVSFQEASARYGRNIRRAKTYKALNVFNQGTSADIMKQAMVDAFEAGLFADDKLGLPHLTVHDELDLSVNRDMQQSLCELQHIMENCIKLKVPLVVEAELGDSWGNIHNFDLATWKYL